MKDLQYQVKLQEKIAIQGTLLWIRNDAHTFKEPMDITITVADDLSCKVSVPDLNTFAIGQSMDEALQHLLDEMVFLEHCED
jgi:hypothetical protein